MLQLIQWQWGIAAPQALTTGDSMKMMQLNWKRSLATFALLAAFNGPEASVAVAQSDKPAPPPVPAPEVAPAPPAAPADPGANSEATEAPAPPMPPPTPEAAADVFRRRYGLKTREAAVNADTNAAQAEDIFRER
jgi:hypothetical protein